MRTVGAVSIIVKASEKVKMRFVSVALVAFFLGRASCQMDCALPTNSDIETVLVVTLRVGDRSSTPEVNVMNFTLRCLALSEERGRYGYVSVFVTYTCTGHQLCPTGMAQEQIESECANGVWNSTVLGTTENTRRTDPVISISTPTRVDCAFCASPTLADLVVLTTDNENHCVGE